jgi:hypothetical protein
VVEALLGLFVALDYLAIWYFFNGSDVMESKFLTLDGKTF